MAVTDEHTRRVPERLHFHLLPFFSGKPQMFGHLHGQEEQAVYVFQGCRESFIEEGEIGKCSASSE